MDPEISWHMTLQGKGTWSRDSAERMGEAMARTLLAQGFQAGLVNVTNGTRSTSYSFQAKDVDPEAAAPGPDPA